MRYDHNEEYWHLTSTSGLCICGLDLFLIQITGYDNLKGSLLSLREISPLRNGMKRWQHDILVNGYYLH